MGLPIYGSGDNILYQADLQADSADLAGNGPRIKGLRLDSGKG